MALLSRLACGLLKFLKFDLPALNLDCDLLAL